MNVMDDNNDATDHSITEATILSVSQAADYVGVSPKTIYRALDARRLKHACIGQSKCYRIRREWLDAWFDASAVEVEPAGSGFAIEHPATPPRTANSGPYAQQQTPRRGILKIGDAP